MSTKDLTMEIPDSGFLSHDEIMRKFRGFVSRSCREWPRCRDKTCARELDPTYKRQDGVVRCALTCPSGCDQRVNQPAQNKSQYYAGKPNPPDTSVSYPNPTSPSYVGDWSTIDVSGTYDAWGKTNGLVEVRGQREIDCFQIPTHTLAICNLAVGSSRWVTVGGMLYHLPPNGSSVTFIVSKSEWEAWEAL